MIQVLVTSMLEPPRWGVKQAEADAVTDEVENLWRLERCWLNPIPRNSTETYLGSGSILRKEVKLQEDQKYPKIKQTGCLSVPKTSTDWSGPLACCERCEAAVGAECMQRTEWRIRTCGQFTQTFDKLFAQKHPDTGLGSEDTKDLEWFLPPQTPLSLGAAL